MPDQAGRPTAQDWLGVAGAFTGLQRSNLALEEKRQDMASRERVERYLNMMTNGQKPDPKAPDYSYADHMAASGVVMRNQLADEQFKSQRMANEQARAEMRDKDVKAAVSQAGYFYYKSEKATGDAKKRLENQAYDALLPVYKFFPDGNEFVRWKDDSRQTMIMKNIQGKEFEQPAMPLGEAMQTAAGFSRNYVAGALQTRQKIDQLNAEMMIKAATDPNMRQMTPDGREAIYGAFYDTSDTGDIVLRQTWRDPKSGKVLKGFDEASGRDVSSKMDFRSAAYWKAVKALDTDQRKAWEKAYLEANKDWQAGVKEGLYDPSDPSAQEKRLQLQIDSYRRLTPGGPLPEGLVEPKTAPYALDDWRTYLGSPNSMGAGKAGGQGGGDLLMAAHKPVTGGGTGGGGIVSAARADTGGAAPAAQDSKGVGAARAAGKAADGYSKVVLGDDGVIWGEKNGQTMRVAVPSEKPGERSMGKNRGTVKTGDAKGYAAYVAALKKYGLYAAAKDKGLVE